MSTTSPVRIAKMLMFGVPLAVVAVGFLAPLIVSYETATLSPGTRVNLGTDHILDEENGRGEIQTIHENGLVTVKMDAGHETTVPLSSLTRP